MNQKLIGYGSKQSLLNLQRKLNRKWMKKLIEKNVMGKLEIMQFFIKKI